MSETVRGPVVRYLDGEVRCPLAGTGSRGPRASNRLALDDADTLATIDHDARRIVIVNERRYERQTLIGDFVALGRGRTEEGIVTFAVHVRLDKKGTTVRARPHLHPVVRAQLLTCEIDPYEILVPSGARQSWALTAGLARYAVIRPPASEWLGRALLSVRAAKPSRDADATTRVADLIVGAGLGPLRRDVMRVEAHALSAGAKARTLSALLGSGAWELRLTALSGLRSAREHLARAMFLLDLSSVPALARVASEGLRRGDALRFRLSDGRGTVSLGGASADVPRALDVARAYLEFDFIGAILARELAAAIGGDGESRPRTARDELVF